MDKKILGFSDNFIILCIYALDNNIFCMLFFKYPVKGSAISVEFSAVRLSVFLFEIPCIKRTYAIMKGKEQFVERLVRRLLLVSDTDRLVVAFACRGAVVCFPVCDCRGGVASDG